MSQMEFPEGSGSPHRVYTIGHSTQPLDHFIAVLRAHGVTKVADIRTVPRSRKNPQFNKETLPGELEKAGIKYEHLPGLGGLRKPHLDSINTGWENDSFRGYADYMQTPEFEEHLGRLMREIDEGRDVIAIMCAESVYWRCHRRMIADTLTARGYSVGHITGPGKVSAHEMTPWAKVEAGKVTYPGTA